MRHVSTIAVSARIAFAARAFRLATAAALSLTAGCATTSGRAPGVSGAHRPDSESAAAAPTLPAATNSTTASIPAAAVTNTASVIRPGFVLRIGVTVAAKKELEEAALRVSDEGEVKLPFLGPIKVAGLSLADLTDKLTKDYGEYFVNPQLSVDFVPDEKSAPWGSVTILGRVKNPGRIALPPTRDFKISAAIQSAGGFDTSADQSDIRVTRPLPDGTTRTEKINLKAVGAKGDVAQDMVLEDGDVIFIPEMIF